MYAYYIRERKAAHRGQASHLLQRHSYCEFDSDKCETESRKKRRSAIAQERESGESCRKPRHLSLADRIGSTVFSACLAAASSRWTCSMLTRVLTRVPGGRQALSVWF